MTNYDQARAALIKKLSSDIKDQRVLDAMSHIPREEFIPPKSRDQAYEDIPLPIGLGQTISQPYIIALMTEALEIKQQDRVLEIGTGSGYQTAILAEIADKVVTVERITALADSAQKVLASLGYTNIVFHIAEATLGWKIEAPYDAIIVTAGSPHIPDDLVAQLAIGGRMVIPVGSRHFQELCKIIKGTEKIHVQKLGGCRFVSLIGENAWEN